MNDDFIITSKSGKTYNGMRAYHIALGHAVRQALLNFVDDIEKFCQDMAMQFYNEYSPTSYERTYQLLNKMQIGQLIKAQVQGNWEGKGKIFIEPFDWTVLEARFNGYGEYNTYTSFDNLDNTSDMEEILAAGISEHSEFMIRTEVEKYIKDNLDNVIEKAIKNM